MIRGRLNLSLLGRTTLTHVGVCMSRFQLAYLDFFEDEWVKNGYDWKMVAIDYMMKGPQPLLHGAVCGRKSIFSKRGKVLIPVRFSWASTYTPWGKLKLFGEGIE